MARFGPLELVRVALVRQDVKDAVLATMQAFEDQTGMKTFVPEDGGYRSMSTQTEVYADSLKEGFRAAPPGKSKHEFGAAIDLQIINADGTVREQNAAVDESDPDYELLATLGESNGLIAGKHFSSGDPDPYHFESSDSLEVCAEKWDALTKERL